MKTYLTIDREASAEFVEKKSRFIGHIRPVTSEAEASAFLQSLKTKYWDAAHNVSAYILRDAQTKRYSDDGEPRGTAGVPVLDVLEKEKLADCAVVVTRYFGGTLLGAGGLVRAYSHACKLAVEAGGMIAMTPCVNGMLCCDYGFYEKFLKLCERYRAVLDDTVFAEKVMLRFHVETTNYTLLNNAVVDISFGRYQLSECGETYAKMEQANQ